MPDPTPSDTDRVTLIRIREGKVSLFISVMNHIEEWCADNGYSEPEIGNAPDGSYEITARPDFD